MESKQLGPFRLAPWFSERVWGRRDLRPWYGSTGTTELVGEAWLTGPQCAVETGPLKGRTLASVAAEGRLADGSAEFPLLVKILFPNDKLSVQVHPDDAQAQAMGHARGKTECWYVLEAQPGASVSLGLREGAKAEDVRVAVANGSLEELMVQVPVSVGDMIFVDAGTVHAIGPGVVLLETQQTCDVTFRSYDYGRPRELHLEHGLRVMKTQTAAGKVMPVEMGDFVRLIEQQYFVVDRYQLAPHHEGIIPTQQPGCLVGLDRALVVESSVAEPVELLAGQAVVLPVGIGTVSVRSYGDSSFLHCSAPAS